MLYSFVVTFNFVAVQHARQHAARNATRTRKHNTQLVSLARNIRNTHAHTYPCHTQDAAPRMRMYARATHHAWLPHTTRTRHHTHVTLL